MVTRVQKPYYDIEKFINACRSGKAVAVWPTARKDAKDFFNLYPDSQILKFIVNDKLPARKFVARGELAKGPPQDIGASIDAYLCDIGLKPAYIAFYRSHKGIWIIKSLHPPKHGEDSRGITHRLSLPSCFGVNYHENNLPVL